MNEIIEFAENDKWFVITEKEINNIKYSYLIKVNSEETDFIDEYKVVKSYYDNNEEYMEDLTDEESKQIISILVPEIKEYNLDKLKELLG